MSKLISEIKVKTQTLKDKRKNVNNILQCCLEKKEPDTHYLCKKYNHYKSLNEVEQAFFVFFHHQEFEDLTNQINTIGWLILQLRGNKWSF